MKIGLVGLPNSGKSTIFNALTKANVSAENYPFCTVEPNIGIVSIDDERLFHLAKIESSEKITPVTIELIDIAGLVKGASKGEGLGNQFLSYIREVDIYLHVARLFNTPKVSHVFETINTERDIEIIETELILADLEVLQRRINKISSEAKSGSKTVVEEMKILDKTINLLNKENLANIKNNILDEWQKQVKHLNLLSLKPSIYLFNLGDEDLSNSNPQSSKGQVQDLPLQSFNLQLYSDTPVFFLFGQLEYEISLLDEIDANLYRQEIGISNQTSIKKLLQLCLDKVNLIVFYTINHNEARCWTLLKRSKVIEAAEKVHTDFARNFIKAEVIQWDKLVDSASWQTAREKGQIRIEGREYEVQDGDVILFKHG